jgi:hypothetical protein
VRNSSQPAGAFFRVSACQIQACTVLAGLLTDPAGPDAAHADLASVVPQVLGPAPVSLRISHATGTG